MLGPSFVIGHVFGQTAAVSLTMCFSPVWSGHVPMMRCSLVHMARRDQECALYVCTVCLCICTPVFTLRVSIPQAAVAIVAVKHFPVNVLLACCFASHVRTVIRFRCMSVAIAVWAQGLLVVVCGCCRPQGPHVQLPPASENTNPNCRCACAFVYMRRRAFHASSCCAAGKSMYLHAVPGTAIGFTAWLQGGCCGSQGCARCPPGQRVSVCLCVLRLSAIPGAATQGWAPQCPTTCCEATT